MIARLRIEVRGVVQGVGFRPFVYGVAERLGVAGFVANRVDGVVIEAEASAAVLAAFVDELQVRTPGSARIDELASAPAAVRGDARFRIEVSDAGGTASAVISPDLATCAACVDEIFDPGSRRAGYAFTSCAACGPRLTIVAGAPYDRALTTMARFAMCGACRREYEDPADRRFHAQPIACPACGPRLAAPGLEGEPVAAVAAALRAGAIVAVKGLGGYHLACDAGRDDVVMALRARKRRDARPFAVMVADVAAARAVAVIDAAAEALLTSSARPIVLVPRSAPSIAASGAPSGALSIAASVAPDGGDVGLMLPYTPLHHLLLRAVGRPLVMTSGNRSDEPMVHRDDDARARLAGIADHFLTHDRDIHARCDDSVARVVDGGAVFLRRSRGYAPAPLRLPRPLAMPTVALGGHQKAVFALGDGARAILGPHGGDLDDAGAYRAFVDGLAHFQALHRIAPRRVVCDRHPEYATSRLADDLARRGLLRVEVGHHHAHMASALVDAGAVGAAIGVCFDGAGLGDDGTIWGGEVLVGTCASARRAAHLRPVPLPGGDRSTLEPWRMAASYLRAAGVDDDAIIARLGARARPVLAVCARPALAPLTSSAGRLFDAVAALTGICDVAGYDAQAAIRLESLARGEADDGGYPAAIERGVIDTGPIIAAVVADVDRRVAPARIARRFHTAIVDAIARACAVVAAAEGIDQVVLSGGCFQNAILAAEVPRRLAAAGLRAFLPRRIPPNDGGLSLGQLAVVAAQEAT